MPTHVSDVGSRRDNAGMSDIEQWWADGEHVAIGLGGHEYSIFVRRLGSGPSMTLLHGFPSSSFDFHLVLDSLAEHRRVLLIDMVGYGLSSKPDRAYTMDLQADVVMAYSQ